MLYCACVDQTMGEAMSIDQSATPEASRQRHDGWPEPDLSLLEEGRPELPDFPLDCLPPWWRTWVSEVAAATDAPVDYVVQALLASVAGLCGAGVVARLSESS